MRSGAFPDDAHSFHDKKRARQNVTNLPANAPESGAAAPRLRAVYGPSEG